MTNRSESTVILIGGPDAGKTNFIGRFWMSIDASSGVIVKDGNPRDLAYLQSLAEKLLQGSFAPHTSRDEPPNISSIPIKAKGSNNGFRGNLIIPDCSGEEWLSIYKKREWSSHWEQLVSEACGCLVFIRADSDQITPMLDWHGCSTMFAQSDSDSQIESDREVEHEILPTEIILIDWLQCLQKVFVDRVPRGFNPRIGLVVTAWDLVPPDQQILGPDFYLAENFPMLDHFMKANAERFCFSTFGVSVVGGDLSTDPPFRESYLHASPLKSGYVYHSIGGSVKQCSDITIPVAWAMGAEV